MSSIPNFTTVISKLKLTCFVLYGSVLWDISGRSVNSFYVAWRKAVRKLLSLPPMTHCSLLPLIIDSASIEYVIQSRFLTFMKRANSCNNEYLSLTVKLISEGSGSSVSKSLTYIAIKQQIDNERFLLGPSQYYR